MAIKAPSKGRQTQVYLTPQAVTLNTVLGFLPSSYTDIHLFELFRIFFFQNYSVLK